MIVCFKSYFFKIKNKQLINYKTESIFHLND